MPDDLEAAVDALSECDREDRHGTGIYSDDEECFSDLWMVFDAYQTLARQVKLREGGLVEQLQLEAVMREEILATRLHAQRVEVDNIHLKQRVAGLEDALRTILPFAEKNCPTFPDGSKWRSEEHEAAIEKVRTLCKALNIPIREAL